jgi:Ni/Co efflux regulator RcnB
MNRLLISAAALALLAAPALLGSTASAQTYSRSANPQDNRRPESSSLPTSPPATAPAAAAPAAAPADRGNGQGRNRDAAAPAATPQPQAAAPQGRGDRGNGGDHGNGQGRGYDQRGDQGRGNWQGRGQNDNNQYNNNYNNRGNGYGNRGNYGGQRHDFSNYRDFHRDFRAQRSYRAPYYRRPAGWYDHRWSFGEFLPSAFWARDYWLSDYRDYDLQPPPYGAIWVRVGNDALLVDQDSGEVITVEYGVFY